jgi:uncharacterized protein (DUF2141 family)
MEVGRLISTSRSKVKSLSHAILVGSLLTLSPVALLAQSAKPASAQVTSTLILQVKGVRNKTGVVRFAIFNSADGWPDDKTKAVRYGSLPANGGTLTFTIAGLPEGSYGISVLHDENENHKLDRDLFGRPKEGIGYNPKIGFSTPTWKQSTVHVAGASIESIVDLRYP